MKTPVVLNTSVVGHRGACAYAPENTMASFIKAAQLGVKWVEFDVMQAKCGEVVVFHDDTLDRTSNGQGDLRSYSYSYLCLLDAGSWFDPVFSGERIPTLLAVIEFLQNMQMSANIEIKAFPGKEESLVKCTLEKMSAYLSSSNDFFIFSSFSIQALQFLRQYSPDCQIGMLLHEWEPDWQEICQSINCVSVHVNHEIMTADMARKIKGMGKLLLCYTVNDVSRAEELYSWGVDAVFSDVPDQIIKASTVSTEFCA
ncbi:MAG: glycerophosphoryl diester phosphodiesterase [Gammaproteobacteria bacterium]|nr:glycerophosphoryl diester phosphodiesterase [Gammaproteobacteria bacterium]MCW5583079.1 glycerophosphoryl diester phosphodiesterase [Gammaproteobacteria bacterium]